LRTDHQIYRETLEALEKAAIPYVVGGGIAVAAYGRKRATKDIDLYIKPDDILPALEALKKAGFEINLMPDVKWLSKAYKKGVPVDFILENIGGVITTPETLEHGRRMFIYGSNMAIMAPEDLVFRKVLAMRCLRDDWYDCIAVLSNTYSTFDWDYFLKISGQFNERALSFVLYVKTDWDHVIPIPPDVISTLVRRMS